MKRALLLISIVLLITTYNIKAQIENSHTVSNDHNFEKLKFSLNATNGQCIIKSGKEEEIIKIYCKTASTTKPIIEERIVEGVKLLQVTLRDDNSSYFSSTFSTKLINFSSSNNNDNIWNVTISKLKPVNLDLNYAIGDSYIDLTGLSIERLKVNTGSANVVVNYNNEIGNIVKMDTFLIKVDMGSFEANNLHLSRSSKIIADVGFGKVKMDFGNAKTINTDVRATIGAGKLEIVLPSNNIPVKININDSPLCQIKLPRGYEKSTNQIFTSPEYDKNQANSINFDVDVAVGTIVFKTAKH